MENTLDLIIINNKEKNNINNDILKTLKPGGYIFSFDVPKKVHNSVCDLEDIGFLIKDSISYFFKENEDVKQDVVCLAMKPLSEKTFADNVLKWGTGALNIDSSRIKYEDTPNPVTNPLYRATNGYKILEKGQKSKGAINFTYSKNEVNIGGRFPANLIFHKDVAPILDKQSDKASRFFKNVDSQKELLKYLTVLGMPPVKGKIMFIGFDNTDEIIKEINNENGTSYETVGGKN